MTTGTVTTAGEVTAIGTVTTAGQDTAIGTVTMAGPVIQGERS